HSRGWLSDVDERDAVQVWTTWLPVVRMANGIERLARTEGLVHEWAGAVRCGGELVDRGPGLENLGISVCHRIGQEAKWLCQDHLHRVVIGRCHIRLGEYVA